VIQGQDFRARRSPECGAMTLLRPVTFLSTGALTLSLCVLFSAAAAAETPSALPPPGTYKVDPDHSFANFGAWHHIVGLVRGRFDKVEGNITMTQDPATCGVDIRIDTAGVSTQNTERDDDLRSSNFFDAKKCPAMTYQGRGIRRGPGNTWTLNGSLTIRGVAQVVPLTFTFNGLFPDNQTRQAGAGRLSWNRVNPASPVRHDTLPLDGSRPVAVRPGRQHRNRRRGGRKDKTLGSK